MILSRFVALAGGPDATIAVISTASSLGAEAGERYRAVFGELPDHAVDHPRVDRRHVDGTLVADDDIGRGHHGVEIGADLGIVGELEGVLRAVEVLEEQRPASP